MIYFNFIFVKEFILRTLETIRHKVLASLPLRWKYFLSEERSIMLVVIHNRDKIVALKLGRFNDISAAIVKLSNS